MEELTNEQKIQLTEIEEEFNLLIKNEPNQQLTAQYNCFLLLLKNYAYKNSFFFIRMTKAHKEEKKSYVKNKQMFRTNYNDKTEGSTYFMTTFWDFITTPKYGSLGSPAGIYPIMIFYSFKKKKYTLRVSNSTNKNLKRILESDFTLLLSKLKVKSKTNDRINFSSEEYDNPIELIDKYNDIINKITSNKDYIKKLTFNEFLECVNKRLELIKSGGSLNKESKDDVRHVTYKNKQNVTLSFKNTILYGPPGTGKTYKTKKLAVEVIEK
jgi:hypothetical protein